MSDKDDIVFIGGSPPGRYDHFVIAEELRAHPGEWARIMTSVGRNAASYVVRGRSAAYAPVGSFQSTSRKNGNRHDVYARYVGEHGEHA